MSKMVKCKVCGKEISKGAKTCPHCGHDNRNIFSKHKILSIFGALVIIGAMGSATGTSSNTTKNQDTGIQQEETKVQETTKQQEETKKKEETKVQEEVGEEITLSDGNYEAGVDFKAGKYDVVAIKGSGNVSSSNMYDGGLNAMMASSQEIKKQGDDWGQLYQEKYSNIKLPKGTELKIFNGVTVKLIPKK